MNYKHLTIDELCCIYTFKLFGMSIGQISIALHRSPSTISRELKRNSYKTSINHTVTIYSPNKAQILADERHKHSHRKLKYDIDSIEYIQSKLLDNWSPEQISHRKKKCSKAFHLLHQFTDIFIEKF